MTKLSKSQLSDLRSYLENLSEKYGTDKNLAVYDSYTQDEEKKLFPLLVSLLDYKISVSEDKETWGMNAKLLNMEQLRGLAIEKNEDLHGYISQLEQAIDDDEHDQFYNHTVMSVLTPAQFQNLLLDTLRKAKDEGILS